MAFMLLSLCTFSEQIAEKTFYGFVENKGQILDQNKVINARVLYSLSLPGLNVNLSSNGFSYDVWNALPVDHISSEKTKENRAIPQSSPRLAFEFHRVDVEFINCNPVCKILPQNQAADYLRYYTIGTDQNGLLVNHFEKIVYTDLYPGIDLEFVAYPESDKPVEYTFVVHPGADVSQIKMQYRGARDAALRNDTICLQLSNTILRESIPGSWLEQSRKKVAVRYEVLESNNHSIMLGFKPSESSTRESLIIDPAPTLRWGTYYGGDQFDQINAVSASGAASLFVGGVTESPTGIATSGAYQTTYGGNFFDGYIAKFDTAGVRQWGTYFGGSEQERIFSVKADNSGNVYAVGNTQSTTNMATLGSHQPAIGSVNGSYDGFLAKFDGTGAILWSTYYGGFEDDRLNDVSFDPSGNVLVCGSTQSGNNIATPGAYQTAVSVVGVFDGFLAKFSPAGIRQWATYYGGPGFEENYSIASDVSGSVFVSGSTSSVINIASPGAFQTSYAGGVSDGFAVKFNAGGVREWATYYGGLLEDAAVAIEIDALQNVYLTGTTSSINGISTPGSFQPANAGGNYDGFLALFSTSGVRQWGTYLGGNDDDRVINICTYAPGGVLLTGLSSSTTGIATAGVYQPAMAGGGDAYIVHFDAAGTLQWGTYFGGASQEVGFCIDQSVAGDVLICGYTTGTNGVSTPNAHQVAFAGGFTDGFLARFTTCTNLQQPVVTSNSPVCIGDSINLSTAPVTNATYLWTGPNGFSSVLQNPVLPNAVPASAGSYSLVITVADCASPSASLNVVVEPIPTASIVATSDPCAGEPVSFSLTTNSSINSVIWNFGDPASGVSNTDTALSPQHIYQDSGFYQTTAILEFNCLVDTLTWISVVDPLPVISVAVTDATCNQPNGLAAASTSGGTGIVLFTWSNGASGNSISGLASGSYTVVATDQSGCSASAPVSVNNSPASGVEVIFQDSILSSDESITVEVAGASTWNWTPATGLNCSDCPVVVASPQSSTTYTVSGIDTSGCPYKREIVLTVEIICNDFFVPNIFSPNLDGDSRNETLCIYSNCIKTMDLGIYNRWGELIFSSQEPTACWDGTHKGIPTLAGVYAYRLFLEQLDGKIINTTGQITLTR